MPQTNRKRQIYSLESSAPRYALHLLALVLFSQVFLHAEANLTRRFTFDSLHGKYLDCHVHTAGIGGGGSGCFLNHQLQTSYKYKIYLKAFGVSARELRQQGDGLVMNRISKRLSASKTVGAAVILALDGVINSAGELDSAKTQVYIPNGFVASETDKYSNLLFGASINPKRKDAIKCLFQVIQDGAVLIKWIPSIMDFDPAATAFIPFYLAMKAAGIPLLTHTGKESSFVGAKDSLCDPFRLELPLKLGLTVIAAHVGTPGKNHGQENFERALIMLGRYPNLYADISSLTQINKLGYFGKILPRQEIKGRLLYGTDFPLIETALVSPYYFCFRANLGKLRAAAKEENPWDMDVALKKVLGVPDEVFTLTAKMLLTQ